MLLVSAQETNKIQEDHLRQHLDRVNLNCSSKLMRENFFFRKFGIKYDIFCYFYGLDMNVRELKGSMTNEVH